MDVLFQLYKSGGDCGAGHLVTATFVQWQKSGDEALPYIVIPASWQWKCEFGSEHNILIILGISFEPLSYPTHLGSLEPYNRISGDDKTQRGHPIEPVRCWFWC